MASTKIQVKTENQKTLKRAKRKAPVEIEFFNILFPSQEDPFRVVISTEEEAVRLHLENKISKQQWNLTVQEIEEHGNSGIPKAAVMEFMQKALLTIDQNPSTTAKIERSRDDPIVDLIIDGGEAILALTLSMGGGVWMPQYKFSLLAVALDKHDVLEAKLRDAMEAIKILKAEMALVKAAPPILSLSSNSTLCVWNGAVQRSNDIAYFKISGDLKSVIILKTGLYQVYVRLAGSSNSYHYGNIYRYGLALQRNGVDVAVCGKANSTQAVHQVLEVMKLSKNDVLQVCSGLDNTVETATMSNRFTIMWLE